MYSLPNLCGREIEAVAGGGVCENLVLQRRRPATLLGAWDLTGAFPWMSAGSCRRFPIACGDSTRTNILVIVGVVARSLCTRCEAARRWQAVDMSNVCNVLCTGRRIQVESRALHDQHTYLAISPCQYSRCRPLLNHHGHFDDNPHRKASGHEW